MQQLKHRSSFRGYEGHVEPSPGPATYCTNVQHKAREFQHRETCGLNAGGPAALQKDIQSSIRQPTQTKTFLPDTRDATLTESESVIYLWEVKGGNYFGVPGRMSLPDLPYEKRQFASCDANKDATQETSEA